MDGAAVQAWLEQAMGMGPVTQRQVLATLVVVVGLSLLRWVVLAMAWRRVKEVQGRYWWRKASMWVSVAIGLALVAYIWFSDVVGLLTFFGLVSAGLAIALKDLVGNFVGWVFILWRRPFEVGDRIQMGDHAGDVIDLRIFQFSLLEIGRWVEADQPTGRIVHVPNGMIFTVPVANYTRGFEHIWNEIPVVVTFESDWRAAKGILERIADAHGAAITAEADSQIARASRTFSIASPALAPRVFTSVADHGVVLTVRYLTDPRERRATTQAIWEDILQAFAERDDVDFAYPTTRLYDNPVEGKPGARADRP